MLIRLGLSLKPFFEPHWGNLGTAQRVITLFDKEEKKKTSDEKEVRMYAKKVEILKAH